VATQFANSMIGAEENVQDVGPLVWILREVDHTLEAARQSLRKFSQDQAERGREGAIADTSPLRTARAQLHQATGAVEVVGLAGAPSFLRALESAVAHCVDHPEALTAAALADLERAMNALHEYFQSSLSGRKPQPLKLFTSYESVLRVSGTDRIHPADLWDYEFEWHEVKPTSPVVEQPRQPESSVTSFDRAILTLLRGNGPLAAEQLMPVVQAAYAGSAARSAKSFWAIAAAVVEALSKRAITVDDHLKRAFTRMSLQIRSQQSSSGELSERLGRDLLFFTAQAAPIASERSMWLGPVLAAYGLTHYERVDYSQRHYAAVDPALLQLAQRRVSTLRQLWAELSNGDITRIRSVVESADLVAESITQLRPDSEGSSKFGATLSKLIKLCTQRTEEMTADRALEAANAVLFLEAALQSGEINGVQFNEREAVLSERLQRSINGQAAGPMDAWMEELYRKSSEAQTMGSVVQELKISMGTIESALDRYFRNSNDREALVQVPGLLSQARGVLSVLGLDHAASAAGHARLVTENWVLAEGPAPTEQSHLLAQNLGALSLMVDLLGYQPAAAKAMFVFDSATQEFRSGLRETLKPKKQDKTSDHNTQMSAELDQVAQALNANPHAELAPIHAEALESKLEALKVEAAIADAPAVRAAADHALDALRAGDASQAAQVINDHISAREPAEAKNIENEVDFDDADTDDDLLDIFLDEAAEVTETGELQIVSLRHTPADQEALITLRRSFHTLKGSSRMVGLSDFGESAWQMEQVLNSFLSEPKAATSALLDLSADAIGQFKSWANLIKHQKGGKKLASLAWPAIFTASAEAFKAQGAYIPIALNELSAPAIELDTLSSQDKALDVGSDDFADFDFIDGSSEPVITQATAAPHDALAALENISLDLSPPVEIEAFTETSESSSVAQAEEVSLEEFLAVAGINAEQAMPTSLLQASASDAATIDMLPEVLSASPSAQLLMHPSALPLTPAADDEFKQIGDLRIPIGLHNIYLNEADELMRKLTTELDEWRFEGSNSSNAHDHAVPEGAMAAAHTLAGTSATVGLSALANLGYDLEAALLACQAQQHQPTEHDHTVLNRTAEEMRKLLHQFAAGFIKTADADTVDSIAELKAAWRHPKPAVKEEPQELLAEAVAEIKPSDDIHAPSPIGTAAPIQALVEEPELASFQLSAPSLVLAPASLSNNTDELNDTIDIDLFPIFEEEALELLPSLAQSLRSWQANPKDYEAPKQCLRVLHTFKGSARLAGAMNLGEMSHQLETDAEMVLRDVPSSGAINILIEQCDEIVARFELIRRGEVHSPHEFEYHTSQESTQLAPRSTTSAAPVEPIAVIANDALANLSQAEMPELGSKSAFKLAAVAATAPQQIRSQQVVRVKAGLLDRLFNQAGEVSITRARLENEIGSIKGSLGDLTDNLSRLREQLRAIELQAETQMQSRMAASKEATDFDPLEFDRFTRFQELTRMMAESVNDVATVQQTLNRTLVTTEDDLQRQARMTRELQRDLLRTRMIEFESLSERLYRVVRQVAKELGKNVRLDITGGQIEIDRGVLERMAGSFEHLLRNCVAHGIELPDVRAKLGKVEAGQINITLKQEGNEVAIVFSDDGAGLDFARIREKAAKLNLLDDETRKNDSALAELIFSAGFSTADAVSEISGRGIGMDVVKSEILGLGGRVTVATEAQKSTTFTLVLPLTTAVTQIVLVRSGDMTLGLPSSLIEVVQRLKSTELIERYTTGLHSFAGLNVDFFPLKQLLHVASGEAPVMTNEGRTHPIVVVRSAAQRVAVHVDEILGNQEVVVRNLGPQLSRVPGLAGMSVLASGAVVLIYNPVALAAIYGPGLKTAIDTSTLKKAVALAANSVVPVVPTEIAPNREPTVMVVDDSLTVRRVTQRLLQRNGYKVVLAKDGLDALEILQTVNPDVMLLDIEMPRMDGFDLTRNMRSPTATSKLRELPIVMITSRIANKHKTLALELGVNHYLGKPYNEEELIKLISQYVGAARTVTAEA
jgi:chemosensory pili system protein ChpA (sensor histidine kinase/response regulator)